MTQTMVPDWGRIIDELEGAGVTREAISSAMGTPISNHMIRFYKDGCQPVWFRGHGLITLWCEQFKCVLADAPRTELRRGYRAQGSYTGDKGPKVQALPKWPPAVPVSVAPVKRRKREAA